MKRIIVVVILVLMLMPNTAQAQEVIEDSVVFYSSGMNPVVSNVTVGEYVSIMFFAKWNLTNDIISENDSLTVYFGADLSTEEQDWQLESVFDPELKGFIANFTNSEACSVEFYIADVLLADLSDVAFTQSAENITVQWVDQALVQPPNYRWMQVMGILISAFGGVFVVVILFFHKENTKRLEWEKQKTRRNSKKPRNI